jgi:hypothetical protein
MKLSLLEAQMESDTKKEHIDNLLIERDEVNAF